ncbi:LLM class flavin-dependent oxidoreductase [Actinomadura rugatobispora]|uniref:LLM class flavin-dependent oxidoreductase n=1 Tax=Actinomadura rugatobispora TaxID=1994 RepID=A0ABW0ZR55_9ACTN|nr:hypothetical protein GCM10010200_023430 [Actinomadura rugatobispora]
MSEDFGARIHLALALSGDQALTVLADDALLARLDRAPLAFTVVGADRLAAREADGEADGARTIDPSTATAVLAGRTVGAAFLAAASPARDHPYNLARRIASAGHLSRGRTGLAAGSADPFVADGAGRSHGGGPVLTARPGAAATRDLVLAVQKLEQTWPYDAIVADRERRIFARGDRIRRAGHDGVFPTAGPLTLPSTPEGSSPVAWWASAPDELEAAAEVADVVIVPEGDDWAAGARAALDAAPRRHFTDPAQRPLLFTVIDVAPGTAAGELRTRIDAAGAADGIVLRPAGADPGEAIGLATDLGGGDRPDVLSLRARLGLPRTADLLPEGPGVFPEPAPQT